MKILSPADAVEVAHQISELLRTRRLRALLTKNARVVVPVDLVTIHIEDGGVHMQAELPPHVLRFMCESGMLEAACEKLIAEHEAMLWDLVSLEVRDEPVG